MLPAQPRWHHHRHQCNSKAAMHCICAIWTLPKFSACALCAACSARSARAWTTIDRPRTKRRTRIADRFQNKRLGGRTLTYGFGQPRSCQMWGEAIYYGGRSYGGPIKGTTIVPKSYVICPSTKSTAIAHWYCSTQNNSQNPKRGRSRLPVQR